MSNIIKIAVFAMALPLLLVGCFPSSNTMDIEKVYSFAVPKTFPAAAAFMTIHNNTSEDDTVIGFKTDIASRTELHTMEMNKGIMKMRQVDGYAIPAGESHELKPGADHIMVFGLKKSLEAGQSYDAVVVFEKAGEVPVTVTVQSRAEMMKYMQ